METADALLALPWRGRAIGLMDLDAFFAAVEMRDHPEWRGKPLIVGGSPEGRGVVSTASYEARRYGVHSAMASAQAARLCPHAIWVRGNHRHYREVSAEIMDLIARETPYMERMSIDEAAFDITPGRYSREHPVAICQRIQGAVDALGLSCSIGLSTSRTVSKIASDHDKPHGLTVVPPGAEGLFLADMPLRALPGVGSATEGRLKALGIHNLGELAAQDDRTMERALGSVGPVLAARARGIDPRGVLPFDSVEPAKSVSCERTFEHDLMDRPGIEGALWAVAEECGRRTRAKGLKGRVVTLKLKFSFEKGRSAQKRLSAPTADEVEFWPVLRELLDRAWSPGTPVRLIGVGLSHFEEEPWQAALFAEGEESGSPDGGHGRPTTTAAADSIRARFGDNALVFGRSLPRKRPGDTRPPEDRD